MDSHHEKMLQRADHERTERKDREMEKLWAKRVPTPESDASWSTCPYAGPWMNVHVGRDLERRLTVVREALERVTLWSTENSVLDVARKALAQTAPKP